MNILLYIPYVDKSFGGVLQYSQCLVNILVQDKNNHYYLLLRNNFDEFVEFQTGGNLTVLDKKETDYRTSLFTIWELFLFNLLGLLEKFQIFLPVRRPNVVEKIIKKYKIHILHSPYQHLPSVSIPTIATLHDLQELHFPDFFSPEVRAKRAVEYLNITKKASKIIVSFNHVKEDIKRYFNVKDDKIGVVLLNMQNLWFEKFTNKTITQSVSVPESFLFYPAATWKHKNHINLVKAIKWIKENYKQEIRLICSGHQTEYFNELQEKVLQMGLENQIQFLGKVTEEDLVYLYRHCTATIIPTLYEAGSFPLVESIMMKVPCICSNVTSLPETISAPEYTFDPTSVQEMAEKIVRVMSDREYRMQEIEHYKNLLKDLTNTHSLQKILYIYDSLRPEMPEYK